MALNTSTKNLLLYGGIGVVVVVLLIVAGIILKKKENYAQSTGTASNSLTLTTDSNGNLSTVATVPIGTIVAWFGASSTVPTGWAVCDGTNGTPNLIDRFIIGASSDSSVGDTGNGSVTVPFQHTHVVQTMQFVSDPGYVLAKSGVITNSGHTYSPYNTATEGATEPSPASFGGMAENGSVTGQQNLGYFELIYIMKIA